MAQHVVTLYDEIHRVFYLRDNLTNDANFQEVRIGQDAAGHFLLLIANGTRTVIRLKGVKIPPSTAPDFDALFKNLAEKFSKEFDSLI